MKQRNQGKWRLIPAKVVEAINLVGNFLGRNKQRLVIFLGKIKIGRRLILFNLILILTIVLISTYQFIKGFSSYSLEVEQEKLQNELNHMHKIIENELTEVERYINDVSGMKELVDLVKTNSDLNKELLGDVELIFNQKIKAGNYGVEIRDNKHNILAAFGNPLEKVYSVPEVDEVYKKIAQYPMKMKFSFITLDSGKAEEKLTGEDDYFIWISSVAKIAGSTFGGTSGAIIGSKRYSSKDFFNKILPDYFNYPVQLYKGSSLFDTNYFFTGDLVNAIEKNASNRLVSNTYLVDENIIKKFLEEQELITYIERKQIETEERIQKEDFQEERISISKPYLVGYIPIRDFQKKPIAFITVMKPQDKVVSFIKGIEKNNFINVLLFMTVSAIIVFLISRSITQPLSQVVNATHEIAAGNLGVLLTSKTKDELGEVTDNFNDMIFNLRTIVGQIINVSERVHQMSVELSATSQQASVASEEVSAISQEIVVGTEEQVIQTDKTRKILDNLKDQTEKVVEGSTQVLLAVDEVSNKSNSGVEAINLANENIAHILQEVDNTSREVINLMNQISNINKIVELINYINEETSLLSINASIEAARSGQAGRGFAVIAQHIRKLANQSSESVDEISKIFKEINNAASRVIDSMDYSNSLAKKGEEAVVNAQESFIDINTAINSFREAVVEINHYVEEHNTGSGEISLAMDNVLKTARLTAEGASNSAQSNEGQAIAIEQISRAASELASMADHLKLVVSRFDLSDMIEDE